MTPTDVLGPKANQLASAADAPGPSSQSRRNSGGVSGKRDRVSKYGIRRLVILSFFFSLVSPPESCPKPFSRHASRVWKYRVKVALTQA